MKHSLRENCIITIVTLVKRIYVSGTYSRSQHDEQHIKDFEMHDYVVFRITIPLVFFVFHKRS